MDRSHDQAVMDTMRDAGARKADEAAERAIRYFQEGYCCSESVVRSILELYAPSVPVETLMPLASGFCGGMGDRNGVCGVFSGGVLVLGHFMGRRHSGESDREVRRLAGEFQSRLKEESKGALICRDILKDMRFTNWNKRGCRRLTGLGAMMVAELIEENGLVPRP